MKKSLALILILLIVATLSVVFFSCKDTEPTYTVEGAVLVYDQYADFTLNGTTLRLRLADGKEETVVVTQDMIASLPDLTTPGKKTVEISYEGKTCSFEIEVTARDAISYSFRGLESEYAYHSAIDLSNVYLTLVFSESARAEFKVTAEMITSIPDTLSVGNKQLKVTFAGKEYTHTFTVAKKKAAFAFEGCKTEYYRYEQADLSAGTLVLTYPDTTTERIALSTLTPKTSIDTEVLGSQTVSYEYDGFTYAYDARVLARNVASYSFRGVETEYAYHSVIDFSNIYLTLVFEDEERAEFKVTDDMITARPDTLSAGAKQLTVALGGASYTHNITVVKKKAAFAFDGCLTEFFQNEQADLTAGTLTITYPDKSTETFNLSALTVKTAPDTTTLGAQTVVYECDGNSYELAVTVVKNPLTETAAALKSYMYSDAYYAPHDITIKANLSGSCDYEWGGIIIDLNADTSEAVLSPEDSFLSYFYAAFTDAVLSGTMSDKTLQLVDRKVIAEADKNEIKSQLYTSLKLSASKWKTWIELLPTSADQGFAAFVTEIKTALIAAEKSGSATPSCFADIVDNYTAAATLTDTERAACEAFGDALDTMMTKGFDKAKLFDALATFGASLSEKWGLSDDHISVLRAVKTLESADTNDQKGKAILSAFSDTINKKAASVLNNLLSDDNLDEAEFASLLMAITTVYCADSTDYDESLDALLAFLTEQADDNEQASFSFFGLTAAIYAEKALDYNVDYNKVLEKLPLPEKVLSINYNKYIGEALNDFETDAIFSFATPIVSYVFDEDGALQKELITFRLGAAFETLFFIQDATLTITVEIAL